MGRVARVYLMVVSVLNGFAGLVCGAMLIAQPDGHLLQMGALLPVVARMPLADIFFRDFFWLGVAMLVALGVPNTVAAVMLFRRHRRQYSATLVCGVLLVLWCSFESIYMINAAAVGYFVVGALSIAASALLMRSTAGATT
jgi:hypothetical protein